MAAILYAAGRAAAVSRRALRGLPAHRDEALGALNGLVGDVLDEQGHRLAIPMRLRVAGEPRPRLCLFVHGIMASEHRWKVKGRHGATYGSLLAEDRGVTPVFVTYNSGRHISTNGRELSDRLEALVRDWPVPVEEVNLVGHSMGGLVVRSACHYGRVDGAEWAARVRRVFLLGAPNRGATIEQVAHAVLAGLQALPVGALQALGRLANRRSAGIKDLRHGSLLEEDWQLGRRHEVEVPEGAEVFVACASLVGSGDHPVAKALGDVLVTQYSAQGRRPRRSGTLCPPDRVRVFGGTGHLGLAGNPDVYEQILAWWPDPLEAADSA
jgi:triacylglycerol lipase